MKLGEYFKDIYCINLDRRPDRWDESIKEFSKLNLNVKRFSATDGKRLNLFDPLYSGEIAGAISHTLVISESIDKKLKNVLILEDDVEFSDNFENVWETVQLNIPENWDILVFGGNHVGGYSEHSENLIRIYGSYALQCYAINGEAMVIVRDYMSKWVNHVLTNKDKLDHSVAADYFMSHLHLILNVYCVYPNITWQRESFSDLRQEVVNYEFLKA
jgi:glycosyl transferase, family 25